MQWSNVRLIFLRETRDQMRDRRMIFMIAVLPLVLYPLLGLNWIQVSQFMQDRPSKVLIVGADHLPEGPPLLADEAFSERLCPPVEAGLLNLSLDEPDEFSSAEKESEARASLQAGLHDAVVVFPHNFAEKLAEFQQELAAGRQEGAAAALKRLDVPQPSIYYDAAKDSSMVARQRVNEVLRRWRDEVVRDNLRESKIPIEATDPFEVASADVALDATRRAARWSKLLPFIVVVWALTGAFYPAIDLCAGEKERGTLETLLASPAARSEIVWGKLMTVMLFSMITSLLNLLSMGATGLFVISKMSSMPGGESIGAPPLAALLWLALGLIPIAALFSALALAIAAFARSTKEGQYYLMPLLLVTMPLMMLPMTAELELGTALIPISGLMLLLRKLIEGEFATALTFLPPVAIVTGVCCLLSIRWAIDQFHKESVLFRESERWGLGLWLRHVIRERRATPSVGEALLCGLLLLIIRFFVSFTAGAPGTWQGFVAMMMVSQIALIAFPALLMTIILTREPLRTLGLRRPSKWSMLIVAPLLALVLHPAATWLSIGISQLYPLSSDTIAQLAPISASILSAPVWQAILVIAVIPAICEELAFRGFILSGMRHIGRRWTAILLASAFFGVTHGILQQSISATILGVVIGFVAVQTGSVIPAILFHATHNALSVVFSHFATRPPQELATQYHWLVSLQGDTIVYQWPVVAAGLLGAYLLAAWLYRQPFERYAEEELREKLSHANRAPAQLEPNGA